MITAEQKALWLTWGGSMQESKGKGKRAAAQVFVAPSGGKFFLFGGTR
jgi:hypothetical protein